jgi:hypothetical protein
MHRRRGKGPGPESRSAVSLAALAADIGREYRVVAALVAGALLF